MAKKRHNAAFRIRRFFTYGIFQWALGNKLFIAFCVILLVLYISHGNAVRMAAWRLHVLRDSLANIKADAMAAAIDYQQVTNLSAIKKELRARGSMLQEPNKPPIILREK